MEKYTIPRIVKERICVAPMDEKLFEKFKQKVTEYFGKDEEDLKFLHFFEDRFYRIYKAEHTKIGGQSFDYLNDVDFNLKASKTIEFSQIDFEEEEKQFNPNSLISKKAKGFKFEGERPKFQPEMEKYIGLIGEVTKYNYENNSCSITFKDTFWNYPAELIHLHLVEEETPTEVKKDRFCSNCGEKFFDDEGMQIYGDENIYCDSHCYVELVNKNKSTSEKIAQVEPEELDLTKILIEGETYYSSIFGDMIFDHSGEYALYLADDRGQIFCFETNGKYYNIKNSEMTLFPSKEIRTWENYSPFKKGEVCYFWNIERKNGGVGFYYGKEEGIYYSAMLSNGHFEKNNSWMNCELYDKSKKYF